MRCVSIHALLAESDWRLIQPGCGRRVSIHALLAESDQHPLRLGHLFLSFNPRPPCGERLYPFGQDGNSVSGFNPRPPCGERPRNFMGRSVEQMFQSTPSLRRATGNTSNILLRGRFQSTPSLRRATARSRMQESPFRFQSTPSLRRATKRLPSQQVHNGGFNPRPPCGERLGRHPGFVFDVDVSIHALLAESDIWGAGRFLRLIVSIHALLAESDCLNGTCC